MLGVHRELMKISMRLGISTLIAMLVLLCTYLFSLFTWIDTVRDTSKDDPVFLGMPLALGEEETHLSWFKLGALAYLIEFIVSFILCFFVLSLVKRARQK